MSNKTFATRPFEKLRKKIERIKAVPLPAPSHQKKMKEVITDDELFNTAMSGVEEIVAFRSLSCSHNHRKVNAAPRDRNSDEDVFTLLGEITQGARPMHLPDTQEYVEWTNPEYHEALIHQLHQGQFSIQDFLDLHGCTVQEAEEELDLFIQESLKKGLRCVKIIHGRGLRSIKGPRIKDAVIKRLKGHYRKDLIAYVTARQCDGGLGALYILFKKCNLVKTQFR